MKYLIFLSILYLCSADDILQYTFTNLTPGQLYKISIATVNSGTQSDQASVYVITGTHSKLKDLWWFKSSGKATLSLTFPV